MLTGEEETASRNSEGDHRQQEKTCCRTAAGSDRTGALVNGALIAIGTLGVIDNLAVHWLLGLHRAVPGRWAAAAEVALVALSLALLLIGLGRELHARRGLRQAEKPSQ